MSKSCTLAVLAWLWIAFTAPNRDSLARIILPDRMSRQHGDCGGVSQAEGMAKRHCHDFCGCSQENFSHAMHVLFITPSYNRTQVGAAAACNQFYCASYASSSRLLDEAFNFKMLITASILVVRKSPRYHHTECSATFYGAKANAFLAPETPKSPAHTEKVLGGLCCSSRQMSRSEAFSLADSVLRGIKPRSFCHDSTRDMEHPWCGDVKIAVEATRTLCYPKLPGGVLSQLSRAAMGAKVKPYAASDTPRLRQLLTQNKPQTATLAARPWRKS
jgi:hypothetical protein